MSTIADATESTSPSPASTRPPTKLSQLELLLKQGKVLLQDLRSRLEQASTERDQLAATLKERDAQHERLWAEQADLQRADSARHERELSELRAQIAEAIAARDAARADLESQHATLAGVRSQLEDANARRQQLADEIGQAEAQRSSLEKALATAVDEVEQLRADADRAAALAREIFETHHK